MSPIERHWPTSPRRHRPGSATCPTASCRRRSCRWSRPSTPSTPTWSSRVLPTRLLAEVTSAGDAGCATAPRRRTDIGGRCRCPRRAGHDVVAVGQRRHKTGSQSCRPHRQQRCRRPGCCPRQPVRRSRWCRWPASPHQRRLVRRCPTAGLTRRSCRCPSMPSLHRDRRRRRGWSRRCCYRPRQLLLAGRATAESVE